MASSPSVIYNYHHNHQYNEQPTNHGILGTGLFFTEAKKHARLAELIKAGTYVLFSCLCFLYYAYLECISSIMRSRAYTLDVSRQRGGMSPMLAQAQAMHAVSTSASASTPKARGQTQPQPGQGAQPALGYGRARAVSTRR